MSALITLAASIGAPVIEQILTRRLGPQTGEMAGLVLDTVARRLGVEPGALDSFARDNPQEAAEALREAETMAPGLVALYQNGLAYQTAALQAERGDPVWMRAWRPLGMYLIGFLWLWNVVVLHSLNAVFRIALPPVDWAVLLQVSSVYMGLYMGGHTIKDMAAKWATR